MPKLSRRVVHTLESWGPCCLPASPPDSPPGRPGLCQPGTSLVAFSAHSQQPPEAKSQHLKQQPPERTPSCPFFTWHCHMCWVSLSSSQSLSAKASVIPWLGLKPQCLQEDSAGLSQVTWPRSCVQPCLQPLHLLRAAHPSLNDTQVSPGPCSRSFSLGRPSLQSYDEILLIHPDPS